MLKARRSRTILKGAISAGLLSVLAAPVQAVNIPEGTAVTPDSVFIINFQVRESCQGTPMDALEVAVPASVQNPTPEALAGWDTEVIPPGESEPADARTIVRWSGGPLEDGAFKEFGLWARFPDQPGATLEFPAVQRCGTVERVWDGSEDGAPVPTVQLTDRILQRDLMDLNATVDGMVSDIDEIGTLLGDVNPTNLRSRVSEAEGTLQEVSERLDQLVERIDGLEEASSEESSAEADLQ